MAPVVMQGVRTDSEDAAAAARRHPQSLIEAMPTGLWAWLGPALVTLLAGLVRFWRLGRPHAVVFDETYYVKDSWSLLHHGYEQAYIDNADQKMLDGQTHIFTGHATFVVHPPVGKWLIALGEGIGGLNPTGWRLAVAVIGTASVFLLCRIAMRMTRSIVLGCLAGLLLALDGLAVVMSRTALLDGILAFFVLGAFGCLLIDRDHVRAGRFGPPRLRRPWRWAAGVCFGLALGTKWSALPFLVAFGAMALLWDFALRHQSAPWRAAARATARREVPGAFGAFAIVPTVVYLASWTGWLVTDGGWSRQWAKGRSGGIPFLPDAFRSLIHYHHEIDYFHTHLTEHHPYQSNPWGWPILARPVAYYSTDLRNGQSDCHATSCVREVLGLGTPILWWTACAAAFYMVWRWAGHRDWRAGAVLAGIAAGWLPWFRYGQRPVFYFYSIDFLPFLILGLVLTLGAIIGPSPALVGPRRRLVGSVAAGSVVVLVVVNFFYIYPLLTAGTLSRPDWLARMWFRTWI
jgi:dolichyl-phosphate-mannose--protein O-mannosyl transferase